MDSFLRLLKACFTEKVSLTRTLRFNLRFFPLKLALKIPVFIHRNVRLCSLAGSVRISASQESICCGMIRIGYECIPSWKTTMILMEGGTWVFEGTAHIGRGSRIGVIGELVMGNDFTASYDVEIKCMKRIVFGPVTVVGFETIITDSDNHPVYLDGSIINWNEEVTIGKHNWISSRVYILKGTAIGDDNVIGACALLNKAYPGNQQLIAGNPARVVRTGITWGGAFPDGMGNN